MTTLSIRFAAPLLVLVALFAAPVIAQQLQPIDSIVAVVNEDVILSSELDRAMQNVQAQYAGREELLPPLDVLQKQVLDRLVLVRLQVARAQDSGIEVSDQEVDAAMANIATQNGGTIEQLAAQLASDGLSLADFRNSLRDELLTQRLRQSFARSSIVVSQAEVDAAVAARSGDAQQFHLAHILVSLPDGASAEQIATGQKKIEGIQDLLARGEMDFAAAAVRYSDSQNALEGGDLGWRSLDEIPVAFAEIIVDMAPGQVAGPLRGPSGFQLVQLVETRDASQAGPQMVTEYQARHILIRVDEDTDLAQAKARIDTIRARLAGGADFAEVASELSEDLNTKGQGGDLGWFQANEFGADFGAQIAALQDGEISQPFRSSAGLHVVQRVASRQTDAVSKDLRAQVRGAIGQRKLESQWDRFLRELRGQAYVDIRIGNDDAEPNADSLPAPASKS